MAAARPQRMRLWFIGGVNFEFTKSLYLTIALFGNVNECSRTHIKGAKIHILSGSAAELRRVNAHTAMEGARKRRTTGVADFTGDGVYFPGAGFDEFLRTLDAHVRELPHGRASERLETQPAQVFGTESGMTGE